jgi:16S rRNA (guanine527-N7)-methyltransferase
MNLARTWLEKGVRQFNLELDGALLERFFLYLDFLGERNRLTNLTGLRTPEEVVIKHFLDSLSGRMLFRPQQNDAVIDIGPGAGFPSIPLLMVEPHFHLLLLEPRLHPCRFLQELVERLALPAVEILSLRAENAGRTERRGQAQWVLARAVAGMNILVELALPLLAEGGALLAWKGDEITQELEEARFAISELGGTLEQVQRVTLPFWDLDRNLVLVRKIAPTPERYPRRNGVPQRHPLVFPVKRV